MSTTVAAYAAALCEAEKSKAEQFLNSTRDQLIATLSNLTPAQWTFKPAPDRWSIAENLEHIVFVEGRIHYRVQHLPECEADDPNRNIREMDRLILEELATDPGKYETPEIARPTGKFHPLDLLERVPGMRQTTLEMLRSAPLLRGRIWMHPVFGPWDGYQTILGAGAHGERHRLQILGVKAHANFPGTNAAQ